MPRIKLTVVSPNGQSTEQVLNTTLVRTWRDVLKERAKYFTLHLPRAFLDTYDPRVEDSYRAVSLVDSTGDSIEDVITAIEACRTGEIAIELRSRTGGGVTWSSLHLRSYSPQMSTLDAYKEGDVEALLTLLSAELERAIQGGCDIFIAPESFFSRNDGRPLSADEMAAVDAAITKIIGGHRQMLVIAGTLVWAAANGKCHNTMLLYCPSEGISPSTRAYEKKHWTREEVAAVRAHKGTFAEADVAASFIEFTFRGLSCCAQICADSASPPPSSGLYDLYLVVGMGTGLVAKRCHAAGCLIQCDSTGFSVVDDVTQKSTKQGSEREHFVHIAKSRAPRSRCVLL